ncbi:MAG: hypothetical protein ACYCR8_07995 [Cuniculiplasma sp.]
MSFNSPPTLFNNNSSTTNSSIPVNFSNPNNNLDIFSANSNDSVSTLTSATSNSSIASSNDSSIFVRRRQRRTAEQIQQIEHQQLIRNEIKIMKRKQKLENQAKIEELEQKKKQLQQEINTLKKKKFTPSNEQINHLIDNNSQDSDFINSSQEQQSTFPPTHQEFLQRIILQQHQNQEHPTTNPYLIQLSNNSHQSNQSIPLELLSIPQSIPSIPLELPSIPQSIFQHPIQIRINAYLHQPTLWPHEKILLSNLHKFLSRKSSNPMFEFKRTNSDSCLELELLVKPEAKQSSRSKKFSTLFTNLFCIFAINSFNIHLLKQVKSIEGRLIVNLFLPEDDGEYFTPQIYLLDLKNYFIIPSTSYVTVNHDNGSKFLSVKLPLQQQDNSY